MHPMLTDFGIARLADSPGLTRTHEFVGTPAYVAPESAEGRPQTSAVDIYGAGILLYELVTGRPPFARRHRPRGAAPAPQRSEPRRPSTVPEPLWTVIERCLRKNPDERPSAENLARGLRVVAEGIGVHANSDADRGGHGVAALLAPDPAPTAGARRSGRPDPTQVLPHARAPRARTTRTPRPASCRTPAAPGPADRPGAPPDPHRPSCRPYRSQRPAARRGPEGPHPWQTQLQRGPRPQRADAGPVPRPERGPAAPPPPAPAGRAARSSRQQQPAASSSYAQQQRPQPQQYGQQQAPGQQPQQQQLRPAQQQPQQPQRYAPRARARRAPQPAAAAQPREPRQRSANPMKIPGLGCLKGCLFTIVILFVARWLIWELTPAAGLGRIDEGTQQLVTGRRGHGWVGSQR